MTDCERFDRRMQDRLDAREAIEEDPVLREHVASCAACRERRDAWLRVERGLFPASDTGEFGLGPEHAEERVAWPNRGDLPRGGRMTIVAVTAAAVLLVVALRPFDADPAGSSPMAVATGEDLPTVVGAAGETPVANGSAAWIDDFPGYGWLDRTMPAVLSMRDGVAPLGRSFLQAVTILSHGGGPNRDARFDHGGGAGLGQGRGTRTS